MRDILMGAVRRGARLSRILVNHALADVRIYSSPIRAVKEIGRTRSLGYQPGSTPSHVNAFEQINAVDRMRCRPEVYSSGTPGPSLVELRGDGDSAVLYLESSPIR